jgi:hypothetical protein
MSDHAFRCVRHCAVLCPSVAVSGHAIRCVRRAPFEAVRRVRRRFNLGISNAASRSFMTESDHEIVARAFPRISLELSVSITVT